MYDLNCHDFFTNILENCIDRISSIIGFFKVVFKVVFILILILFFRKGK